MTQKILKRLNGNKMKKSDKYVDENLVYIFENTTPYERLIWLRKALNFWKLTQKHNKYVQGKKQNSKK